ncbi:MAG: sigma-54 dependent transcriptional regulator, partial [Gemmatimonadota bacterium]|nr:sigma-54 dependent transcriptional regulator [Gemmatimonadota bacterium]
AGATLLSIRPDDEPAEVAVVLVAAGGEEEQGLDVLRALADRWSAPLLLVGATTSHRFAVEALRRGATDYFALPEDADLLRRTLTARVEAARARMQRTAPEPGDPFAELAGESTALRETLKRAERVLQHGDVTVLLGGETGTGKELLARALHDGGARRDGPFVAVNCAAIPAQLLESELFGHEKGAFTDAHRAKRGLFEEANGGTLFLDEIGHLPMALQGKLLRALDERRVRPVGGNQDRAVDVRIIAATHVELRAAVGRGEFREDLFYRLNVVHLVLPPLRERGNDVVLLAEHFTTQLARRYSVPEPRITAAVRTALLGHRWPGNVRELRHAIERALLLSPPGTLQPDELTPTVTAGPPNVAGGLPFPASLDDVQYHAARAAMDLNDGNKSAAARLLGISRARLQRLLERRGEADAGAD